ncbi:MAG: two-component sensor histidine kinase [Arcobacter sp.]|uniref:HAMP domain-containing sensor histidine kinase n=1 Tax=uncultured Arcobacter sp. TaxID=165434 RepID=UPI000CB3CDF5|nr:ATP-binding protein [uncultured Arcobacter sp.]PLY10106.1 MAG: two-component sensor histidine kinase [Arcobacter sp.]
MLKIHQLFLRSFIFIFLSILLLISIVVYFWSKSIYLDQIEKNILSNIDTLSISLPNLKNIDQKVLEIKRATNLRVTIIDTDGVVVAESDEDKSLMENHGNREEIIAAKYKTYGEIARHSDTLNKDLLYIAKEVTIDDKVYYIRMSSEITTIKEYFIKLTLQLIGIFSIFLLLAFIVSYYISDKIRHETDNILNFLINLTKKKEPTNMSSFYTQEFFTINKLLNKVAIKLQKKEKSKAKHTAKLKLANKQKDEIISAISHEFKNPIAIITGYVQTLQNDKDLPIQMRDKFLTKIDSNANKMTQIIDKLRLALKLEEGRENIEKRELDLKSLCEIIAIDLKDKYPNRTIEISGENKSIQGDDTLISMAISNLIENALKYSEGVVRVEISQEYLKVIDTGIGISETDLLKITRKFYRVSQNGWNNSLGLGLFIVNSILNLHNFKLQISSIYGKGSEFIIKY